MARSISGDQGSPKRRRMKFLKFWRGESMEPGAMLIFSASGLAARLMNEILHWARAEKLDRLVLHASEDGRSLYERLGFARTNEMRLAVTFHDNETIRTADRDDKRCASRRRDFECLHRANDHDILPQGADSGRAGEMV